MLIIDLWVLVGLVSLEILLTTITSTLFVKNTNNWTKLRSKLKVALVMPVGLFRLIELISCILFAVGLQSYVLMYHDLGIAELSVINTDAPAIYIAGIILLSIVFVTEHAWHWSVLGKWSFVPGCFLATIHLLANISITIVAGIQAQWLCLVLFIIISMWSFYKMAFTIAIAINFSEKKLQALLESPASVLTVQGK